MLILPTIKKGDYFFKTVNLTLDGAAFEPSVTEIKSQVRDDNLKLYSNLIVKQTETAGEYTLEAASTTHWTVGKLFMDIEITIDGKPYSSDTLQITVKQDYTYE